MMHVQITPEAQIPRPRVRFNPYHYKRAIPLSALVLGLALWELFARDINPILLSPPSRVVLAMWEIMGDGSLFKAMGESFVLLVSGFVAAGFVGILIGLIMGRYMLAEYALDPYVSMMYALPKSAFAPLVMIWMGLTFKSQLFLVFLSAIVPNIVSTATGVKNVDRRLLDVGRSFGLARLQLFSQILIPAAMPSIITGLRLSVGRATVGMVIAELFLHSTGLGGMVREFGDQMKSAFLIATVLVIVGFGNLLNGAVKLVEARVTRWAGTAADGR